MHIFDCLGLLFGVLVPPAATIVITFGFILLLFNRPTFPDPLGFDRFSQSQTFWDVVVIVSVLGCYWWLVHRNVLEDT